MMKKTFEFLITSKMLMIISIILAFIEAYASIVVHHDILSKIVDLIFAFVFMFHAGLQYAHTRIQKREKDAK